MKLIEGNRGLQVLEFEDGKILRLTGEATFEPPYFYVDKVCLNYWYKPEGKMISDEERRRLIKKLKIFYENKIDFE